MKISWEVGRRRMLAFQRTRPSWPETALTTYTTQRARGRDAYLRLNVYFFTTLSLPCIPSTASSRLFAFFLTYFTLSTTGNSFGAAGHTDAASTFQKFKIFDKNIYLENLDKT